jgi:hypothetical protein
MNKKRVDKNPKKKCGGHMKNLSKSLLAQETFVIELSAGDHGWLGQWRGKTVEEKFEAAARIVNLDGRQDLAFYALPLANEHELESRGSHALLEERKALIRTRTEQRDIGACSEKGQPRVGPRL